MSFNDTLDDRGPAEACSINPNPTSFDLHLSTSVIVFNPLLQTAPGPVTEPLVNVDGHAIGSLSSLFPRNGASTLSFGSRKVDNVFSLERFMFEHSSSELANVSVGVGAMSKLPRYSIGLVWL